MPDGWGKRGYRRMYWLTGLPGWARYGYPYIRGYQPGAAVPWFYRCQQFPWLARTVGGRDVSRLSKEDELSALREGVTVLEEELKEIRKRIQELGE